MSFSASSCGCTTQTALHGIMRFPIIGAIAGMALIGYTCLTPEGKCEKGYHPHTIEKTDIVVCQSDQKIDGKYNIKIVANPPVFKD